MNFLFFAALIYSFKSILIIIKNYFKTTLKLHLSAGKGILKPSNEQNYKNPESEIWKTNEIKTHYALNYFFPLVFNERKSLSFFISF